MYQAYKLPKNSRNFKVHFNNVTKDRILSYDINAKFSFRNIISKPCNKVKLVSILYDNKVSYFQGDETLKEFIADCERMQVTSPVLVILKVW